MTYNLVIVRLLSQNIFPNGEPSIHDFIINFHDEPSCTVVAVASYDVILALWNVTVHQAASRQQASQLVFQNKRCRSG